MSDIVDAMVQPDRVPRIVAAVSLVGGAGLLFAPQVATGPLGLDGQRLAVRAVGLADLILVPGLARSAAPAPWMAGRSALSLAQGAYFNGVATGSSRPWLSRAAGAILFALSAADGATAFRLRRAGG